MGSKTKNAKSIGKCGKCNTFFTSLNALKAHLTYFHKTSASYTVNGKTFNLRMNKNKEQIGKAKPKRLQKEVKSDNISSYLFMDSKYYSFECAACKFNCHKYKDIIKHIDSVHRDNMISFFFPNDEVFLEWKNDMQLTTKSKYEKSINLENKTCYVCVDAVECTDKAKLVQCTSTITAREYNKGIQVFFFRLHSGHNAEFYTAPPNFEKYLIFDKSKDVNNINLKTGNKDPAAKEALIRDFRKIIKSISSLCVKLEYTDILKYVAQAKTMEVSILEIISKSEIKNKPQLAIENVNGNININVVASDEIHDGLLEPIAFKTTPLILNTFSLSNSDLSGSEKATEKEIEIKPKIEPEELSPKKEVEDFMIETPSKVICALKPEIKNFNDTYENFIAEQTLKENPNINSSGLNNSSSINNKANQSKTLVKNNKNNGNVKKTCPQPKRAKKEKFTGKANLDGNIVYETKKVNIPIVNMATKAFCKRDGKQLSSITKLKKNLKVKTKLGQFSPKKNKTNENDIGASNSADTPSKNEEHKSELGKSDIVRGKSELVKGISETVSISEGVKSPQLKKPTKKLGTKFQGYEVKERDNDCNILILKF